MSHITKSLLDWVQNGTVDKYNVITTCNVSKMQVIASIIERAVNMLPVILMQNIVNHETSVNLPVLQTNRKNYAQLFGEEHSVSKCSIMSRADYLLSVKKGGLFSKW